MAVKKRPPRTHTDSNLAKMRIARGITQTELAEALGVIQQQVARWESGSVPRIETYQHIGKVLGCDWRDLID